jgi:GntR family transcriptional regulator
VPRSHELPSERIGADLRRRIASGEWGPGDQLPVTRDLAEHYQVSRETISRVVRKLAEDGLVITRGRWGVFVAPGA